MWDFNDKDILVLEHRVSKETREQFAEPVIIVEDTSN